MKKVITYGTYDKLHFGHIRLLERAKALGDYLIVGVTADDFDRTRGKINVQQPLEERIEAVRATGLADEIIVEEYEGQKIDDIRRLGVDIFTVGSDWVGQFDYLNEYCKVVYLERTAGVSSSELRAEQVSLNLGVVGKKRSLVKFINESEFVNGVNVNYACIIGDKMNKDGVEEFPYSPESYEDMLSKVDAVYIASAPVLHYEQALAALKSGKHVFCESPVALKKSECEQLFELAKENGLILMESIKTAYMNAYVRLLLLVKSGRIGDVVSIDATCTSLKDISGVPEDELKLNWNSICAWGPTGMLPVFQLLGTEYSHKNIISKCIDKNKTYDIFTKIDFEYPNAVATVKVGNGIKSEGELVICGTKGYIFVPAPWWKTDYFEVRYEDSANNKRYFYQLDGDGIRYEIVAFAKAVFEGKTANYYLENNISTSISSVIEDFYSKIDTTDI
ncbi:MAG: Gfo/Idh/MocA family oxidoreductase [Clostridiales bacterium]|nr:Gfo/Idh/MocA family oxidoreductase [Clostridia bacterium]MCR4564068.1 Gfo/Idh/MocA family oxidoreductase [Clostridiales bacterium]